MSGRGRACTEAIKKQSLQIRKLIEDLNLTSKLAYHMQPLRVHAFRPAALLRELAAQTLNEEEGEQYGVELLMDKDFEQILIQGDEELLARAVGNLLNNSVRHNPQGCRIVLGGSVLPREEDGASPRIRIAVTDTGVGIPREVIETLNAAAGGTSKTDVQGDGAEEQICADPGRESFAGRVQAAGGTQPPHVMGLRIAAQIAEAHGGFLRVLEEGRRVEIVV